MIFVTDKGRMANNIFQYGHMYAWGRENGRSTMSMRFAHKYPEFKIAHTKYHNFLVYVLVKLAAKLHIIPTVDFSDGQNEQKIETIRQHKHVLVTGWSVRFHSLYQKYKENIISIFDFLPEVHHHVDMILQASTADTIKLGVHIRRGDYKTWLGGRFYYDDTQYLDTIRQFIHLHPEKEIDVYICTNDPHLNQPFYQQHLSPIRVFFSDGSPAEDLCLLSKCDYLIGPLSSFTLIASMYHNTPLYWMMGEVLHLSRKSFYDFNYQACHFDTNFSDDYIG